MAVNMKEAKKMLKRFRNTRKRNQGYGNDPNMRFARTPVTGKMRVRFLPPTPDETVPGAMVYKHYNIFSDDRLRNGSITCFKTWGLDCPICNVIDEYRGYLIDETLCELSGSSSYFNVLILDSPEHNPKLPYILQTGEYTYEWLLSLLLDIDVGDVTDPEAGADVTFSRESKKKRWDKKIARYASAIADTPEEINEILYQMYDLKKVWREPDDNYYSVANSLAEQLRKRFGEMAFLDKPEDNDEVVLEVVEDHRLCW